MKKVLFTLCLFGLSFMQLSAQDLFPYGVASGDPLADRVIIWTKLEPQGNISEMKGTWSMATDDQMKNVSKKGKFKTNTKQDLTVKIDVEGLEAGKYYYYQFEAAGKKSPIGRTKTTPQGKVDRVKLAVVSCSNFQAGYFNAYGNIAAREDLDAIVHLGDYIYEYQDGGYGDSVLIATGARSIEPKTELLSLEDYRARYATYRKDPNLQKLHQMYPFITVWDDHESANNSYKEGAQNHQENEGDWNTRKAVARQAYAEWLPIRGKADRIYRKFQFGDLAELIMLDTRLEGRDLQIEDINDPELYNENRSILGAKQKTWMLESLKNSNAQWKILGNQVMFAEYNVGWAGNAPGSQLTPEQLESLFLDIWDGYPVERAEIIQFIEKENIDDVVIVTGDVHCSFAYDVALRPSEMGAGDQKVTYKPETGEGSVAVEFVTPGITSSNYDEIVGKTAATFFQYQINKPLPNKVNPNPHMKYADLIRHGYMILDLSPEKAQADWYYSKNILEETTEEEHGEGWFTKKGQNRLEKASE